MLRRTFTLALPALVAHRAARAETWQPTRSLRIIVGYSVATTSDLLARLVGQKLGDRLGTSVVVENREGGGGTIAAGLTLRAPADGYTLLMGATALTMAPRLFRDVTFKPLEDFEPVCLIGFAPNVLVVRPQSPIASIADLIGAARATPGRLSYASSGPGSGSWVGMEELKAHANLQLEEIPYSSTAQATTDAMSGQVDLHCPSLAGAMPHIRSGRFRALGITSGRRSAAAPDIPSIAETLPGYDASAWYGVVAPAGLPAPVAERLNAELQAILAEPAMQTRLLDVGVDAQSGSRADMRKVMTEAVTSGNAMMDRINYRPR
jgi:tripartite-type tricarboxylate transporter receptor subunit TctC